MPKAEEAMDAITLLKTDHRVVEELFEKFENARTKAQKQKLAQEICMELTVHTMIEEELFYPAIRGEDEVEDSLLDESHVEHDGAKMLIAEIMAGSPDDDFYDAKVKVLSEEIKHHVKEEEQMGGLFAQAKKTDIDMDALGEDMMERKEELKAQFEKKGIPTPETRTLTGAKLVYGEPVSGAAA